MKASSFAFLSRFQSNGVLYFKLTKQQQLRNIKAVSQIAESKSIHERFSLNTINSPVVDLQLQLKASPASLPSSEIIQAHPALSLRQVDVKYHL